MQPLLYLGARAWLAWLQFCEKSERAFLNSQVVVVAAGAVHSWAVVYSLFVAVHARAARVAGYHEGYVDHLPASVSATETLATGCFWIWLIAGFSTAAVQILDDAPVLGDAKPDKFTEIVRSKAFHSFLANAHSISCAGLFISLLMLCATMAMMSGTITICELCLLVVSVGIALPHAVLAVRRLHESLDVVIAQLLPTDFAEAAAAEAAAMGPQLCILLALVDSPGHAYMWQNFIYVGASSTYVASIVFCALSPPKQSNVALPPSTPETITGLVLDGMAAGVIVMSYPDWNNLSLWMFVIVLIGCSVATATGNKAFRDFYFEWLEPIFPIRTDSKTMPNAQRQLIQKIARALAIVCATAGLWDMNFHQAAVHAGQMYAPPDWSDIFLLRWQPTYTENDNSTMVKIAAEAMEMPVNELQVQGTLPEHRVLLFSTNATNANHVKRQWSKTKGSPKGELSKLVDTGFAPAALDYTMCGASRKSTGGVTETPEHAAYEASCNWMLTRVHFLHSLLSHTHAAKSGAAAAGAAAPETQASEATGEAAKTSEAADTPGSDLG